MTDNPRDEQTFETAGASDGSRHEPVRLSGGKAFHTAVQTSWQHAAGGESVVPELRMDLHRWKDVGAPPQSGSGAFRYSRKRHGRADIRVVIDADDEGHRHVSILEIKHTDFDRMTPRAVRRNIASHRRQLVKYIASELDLGHPDEFKDGEAFVVPGVIYPKRPSDPAIEALIEAFFDEECISVVWEDVPRVEEPPRRSDS